MTGPHRGIRTWARPALIIVVLTIAAWRTLVIGLADQAAPGDATRAPRWLPEPPAALIRAAAVERSDGRPREARELAKAALLANPLDGQAYRELALAEQMLKSKAPIAELMHLASLHAPRDRVVHRWLLEYELALQRHDEALVHLDFLLRRPSQGHGAYYSVLAHLLADPRSEASAIALLDEDPPWRAGFWQSLMHGSTPLANLRSAVSVLDAGAHPLRPSERRDWQQRLLRAQVWQEARAYWLAGLPASEHGPAGVAIHDGGFEQSPDSSSVFGWQLQPIAGATVSQPTGIVGATGKRALQIDFRDRRVAFQHVHQIVLLAPGSYALQGRYRMRQLRNDRGLQWTLDCLEAPHTRLAETDRFRGDGEWAGFGVAFTVRDGACAAQRLTLVVAARVPAEQQIDGTIWFDEIAINSVQ